MKLKALITTFIGLFSLVATAETFEFHSTGRAGGDHQQVERCFYQSNEQCEYTASNIAARCTQAGGQVEQKLCMAWSHGWVDGVVHCDSSGIVMCSVTIGRLPN